MRQDQAFYKICIYRPSKNDEQFPECDRKICKFLICNLFTLLNTQNLISGNIKFSLKIENVPNYARISNVDIDIGDLSLDIIRN